MEASAPATTLEKKEGKGGILETSAFPDPGKKAAPLALAAAVAAQGGSVCALLWRAGKGWGEVVIGPCHQGGGQGL